jgi:hypothetical protein
VLGPAERERLTDNIAGSLSQAQDFIVKVRPYLLTYLASPYLIPIWPLSTSSSTVIVKVRPHLLTYISSQPLSNPYLAPLHLLIYRHHQGAPLPPPPPAVCVVA